MGWIKAQDVPLHLEGTQAWVWKRWEGYAEIDWVPRGFSRAARHCDGIFVWPLEAPPDPILEASAITASPLNLDPSDDKREG